MTARNRAGYVDESSVNEPERQRHGDDARREAAAEEPVTQDKCRHSRPEEDQKYGAEELGCVLSPHIRLPVSMIFPQLPDIPIRRARHAERPQRARMSGPEDLLVPCREATTQASGGRSDKERGRLLAERGLSRSPS
jgi:hypothetical protein